MGRGSGQIDAAAIARTRNEQFVSDLTPGEIDLLERLAAADTGEMYVVHGDRYFYSKLRERGLVEGGVEHSRTIKGKISGLGIDYLKGDGLAASDPVMSGGRVVSRDDLIVQASRRLRDRMTEHDAEEAAFNIVNAYEEAKQRGVTISELDQVIEKVAAQELTVFTESDAIDAAWDIVNDYSESLDQPDFTS
jgi:hypothetical protein